MGLSDFTKNNTGGSPDNNNGGGNNNSGTGGSSYSGFPIGSFGGSVGQQILSNDDILAMMVNMNEVSHNPCLFREKVITQLINVLISWQKPNAILIGQAGTGKTAIVEELARLIQIKDTRIPPALSGYRIFSLPLSNIMAGAKYRGELEVKLNSLLEYLTNRQNRAIVFIDEIHMLLGEDESYKEIAQVFKPALSRGNLHVIGATTVQESKSLDKDPAFNRRFDRILVDELSKEQTLDILNSLRLPLFNHYNANIMVSDQELRLLISIADEYCNVGSHRPDNAITLLDRTVAGLVTERQEMLNNPDPNIQNMAKAMPGLMVTEKSIKKTAMRIATGNNDPAEFVEQDILDALADIKGQDDVLKFVMRQIKIHAMRLHPSVKPLTMLFAGPSGVGKSEVTKRLAKSYFHEKPIILNMTEYSSPSDVSKIIGAPMGYVGYSDNQEMPFDPLNTNPYQVILLDEFEKADKAVQRLFMRVFDEGLLQDSHGRTIDFSKSVIIVTTNAGCTNTAKPIGFNPSDRKISAKLEDHFDTELLGRFEGRILQFNAIDKNTFA